VPLPRQPGRKPIPIIVADANIMASGFVCAELKRHSEFDLVGCATNVGELAELFARRAVRVALISATLQDGLLSGLGAFPQLREKYPDVRLILMIDHPEQDLVVEAFRAGARASSPATSRNSMPSASASPVCTKARSGPMRSR